MNQTGIVRKIDDLGRIVIPKELRKHLNINSGDDFQIILDKDTIILEKYSYLKTYENDIIKIINGFKKEINDDIYLIINDQIINDEKIKVFPEIINIIKERKIYINEKIEKYNISNNLILEGKIIVLPIVINSDLMGALLMVTRNDINEKMNYLKIILNIIKNYYN